MFLNERHRARSLVVKRSTVNEHCYFVVVAKNTFYAVLSDIFSVGAMPEVMLAMPIEAPIHVQSLLKSEPWARH
jgi:hypothetical protein